jgi:DNA polymerase III alpha subunit
MKSTIFGLIFGLISLVAIANAQEVNATLTKFIFPPDSLLLHWIEVRIIEPIQVWIARTPEDKAMIKVMHAEKRLSRAMEVCSKNPGECKAIFEDYKKLMDETRNITKRIPVEKREMVEKILSNIEKHKAFMLKMREEIEKMMPPTIPTKVKEEIKKVVEEKKEEQSRFIEEMRNITRQSSKIVTPSVILPKK